MPKESAYTSLKQIPACFKAFELGQTNLDIGGGKYDIGTEYLKKHGTTNMVYDPFNRPDKHNGKVWHKARMKGVDSITVSNVLNVIQSKDERKHLIEFAKTNSEHRGKNSTIIFQIYEGDRSGIPSKTTVQNNMKTADYIQEIQEVFPEWEVQRQGNFIIV